LHNIERMFKTFWDWYNKHLFFNTALASFLFTLQLVHLYWLTTHVVLGKLTGVSYFDPTPLLEGLILVVDYLEIPAIFTTSLVYINDIRRGRVQHGLLYLVLLNSQWLHIFWITDTYALRYLGYSEIFSITGILAWLAILIDYLEVPVIIDTLRRLPKLLKEEIK
jgi:hypothetical protein